MEAIKTEKEPIAALIKGMNIGENKCYPINRIGSVRTSVYFANLSTEMKFTTKRQGDNICVTRIK